MAYGWNKAYNKPPEIEYVYQDVYVPERVSQATKLTVEATAYTAGYESTGKTPSDIGYGITFNGKKVRDSYVAADIRYLPYGTKLYIVELDKVYEVQDTGGDIKGNRIDIYFDSYDDAAKFGRQTLTAIILK